MKRGDDIEGFEHYSFLGSEDVPMRLPELMSDERIRLINELPAHPTLLQVREKSIEILARRPAR